MEDDNRQGTATDNGAENAPREDAPVYRHRGHIRGQTFNQKPSLNDGEKIKAEGFTSAKDASSRKHKKKLPKWARVLIAALAIVVGLTVLSLVFIHTKLAKIERYDPDTVEIIPPEEETFETNQTGDPDYQPVDPDDVIWGGDADVVSRDGVTNILLIGQDTRIVGENGRSDSMMILTINYDEGTIKLVSLMRDMYVQIPGYSDNRLNAAYRFGGYELLKATIEKNFCVSVDNFIEVDFSAFESIVDILGGVDIELNDEEAEFMNGLGHRTIVGTNHLDGSAALTFCRIRYIGNADYERTERQRRVLSAIFTGIRHDSNIPIILNITDEVFPLVTTSMTNGEIIGMARALSTMNIESLASKRIPADGTFTPAMINGMSVLVPDLESNRTLIRQIIYGDAK